MVPGIKNFFVEIFVVLFKRLQQLDDIHIFPVLRFVWIWAESRNDRIRASSAKIEPKAETSPSRSFQLFI